MVRLSLSESPSIGYDWTKRRWSVWSSSESPSEGYDWTKKESGPYDDASDLYVLPEWSDWTRWNLVLSSGNASYWLVRWICLLETLLIGWSDGSVFKRLLLTYFFTSRFTISYSHSRLTRNDYANASSFCDEYAVKYAVDARNRQNDRHLFVTYSTRGGVLKLCTMPMMWLGKCVRVLLVVNIMIHS